MDEIKAFAKGPTGSTSDGGPAVTQQVSAKGEPDRVKLEIVRS